MISNEIHALTRLRSRLPGMKPSMLALVIVSLSLGWTGLFKQSAAPTAAAVSRVHQLELEDQSENPGNISAEE